VAREGFAKHKNAWAESHAGRVLERLEKDIFSFIAGKAVGSVTAPELLEALRRIEARLPICAAPFLRSRQKTSPTSKNQKPLVHCSET